MQGATKVAFVAALGCMLQGWDNGAIAGALLYLKPEFHLEDKPTIEGFIVAATLVGAVCSTVVAGPGGDWLGRKLMLVTSAFLYSISACAMLWSPNVNWLIGSRFLVGTSIGLVVTTVPIYIAESAPSEIRGQLATFPQLLGSVGLFSSYVMAFLLSLTLNPSWRLMLGVLLIPALVYLALVIFYLPESPRWLVSKGRMFEAKFVLRRLRDREEVSAELALLVEGLGVGGETSLEEWILKPAEEPVHETTMPPKAESQTMPSKAESQIKLFAPEEGIAWIATPVIDQDAHPHHGSFLSAASIMKSVPLIDPVVSLMGTFQEAQEHHHHYEEKQEEEARDDDERADDLVGDDEEAGIVGDFDEQNLQAPLIPRKQSEQFNREHSGKYEDVEDAPYVTVRPSLGSMHQHGSMHPHGSMSEAMGSVGIGGGWQLAWQWVEPEQGAGPDAGEGGFKRVFLLQEHVDHSTGRTMGGSTVSLPAVAEGEAIPAAAIIGQPAQYVKDIIGEETQVGPAMVHPAQTAVTGPAWADLLVGGVKRALIVGLGLQVLQQFSGINAVLYFIPQILEQSGISAALSQAGMSTASASILGSGVTALLMLPCIILAMRLMDRAGRRQLLLSTLPVLLLALIVVILSSNVLPSGLFQASISFLSVTVYVCSFVMGLGPIPNILCSEIFPTRVRGLCIALCQVVYWTCNIVVTYLFPILLLHLGLGGVFAVFAVVCLAAWVFIFLKVPETKGMPLEVISEFFAMSHLEAKKST